TSGSGTTGTAATARWDRIGASASYPSTRWWTSRSRSTSRYANRSDRLSQIHGGDDSHAAGLVVLQGLQDLAPRVHDERAVVDDGLADRQPAEQQQLHWVLMVGRPDGEGVTGAEGDQLVLVHGPGGFVGTGHGEAAAQQHVGHGREAHVPRHREL